MSMLTRRSGFRSALLLGLACLTLGCRSSPQAPAPDASTVAQPTVAQPTITLPAVDASQPTDLPGLHNVVAYHRGFYSGAQPEGPTSFKTLREMGVRTIISVDGAKPDVAAARAHGIRYIHLPIGYDGVGEERGRQISRAVRDASRDGDVYLHCHHGKHRSAGAAAVACVSLGWSEPGQMIERMKVSKTASNYKGLWASAAAARPLTAVQIDAVAADFPEVWEPSGLVAAMVEIDAAYEHLRDIRLAGWKTPEDHPDLVPATEAARLAEAFRLLAQSSDPKVVSLREEGVFVRELAVSAAAAGRLEALLAGRVVPATEALEGEIKAIGASCKACHEPYRD